MINLDNVVEVAKFGGPSLADHLRIDNAKRIVDGGIDGKRRWDLAVSAGGPEDNYSEKPSDILEGLSQRKEDTAESQQKLDRLIHFFSKAAKDHHLRHVVVGPHANVNYVDFIANELSWAYSTRTVISPEAHEVLMISRGEFLQAHIFADILSEMGSQVRLFLPEYMPYFRFIGKIKNADISMDSIISLAGDLSPLGKFHVMPGYYGVHYSQGVTPLQAWGNFKRYIVGAFGRGGTDMTAQYQATARQIYLRAENDFRQVVHVNFTHVPGIAIVDPNIVPDTKYNAFMGYDDAIALGGKLKPEVIELAKQREIPIWVRRSFIPNESGRLAGHFDPNESGTVIAKCGPDEYIQNPNPQIVGISYKKNGPESHQLIVAGPNINENRRVLSGIESALNVIGVVPSKARAGINHVAYAVPDGLETAQAAVKTVYSALFR